MAIISAEEFAKRRALRKARFEIGKNGSKKERDAKLQKTRGGARGKSNQDEIINAQNIPRAAD